MVTSNQVSDKKVVKMADENSNPVVPQRTLLEEVNEQITCPLCQGYYIDATTIVECLHSFCRSCIVKHLQVKSYCPKCGMMINSAKPNIKLDKALQDIVYKLVPGLFQREMERRQQFYSSRPGPAASATPEQRGEDTERIIFSPEDVISFSLEYADVTDTDSISSKSSDSGDPQPGSATTRRYLQCPAVVNISHLKKFLSMKFDVDSSQFAIDILYKRVPLPDYYTLMDIAYIYNWKRNEPMRFFYQIIDFAAIRNRFFDTNRKSSHFRDRKPSLTPTEDTNISSPAQNANDQVSEASSGTNSPMPDESSSKNATNISNTVENDSHQCKDEINDHINVLPKSDEDVEKSQFLNSFELTAKSNSMSVKSSPVKTNDKDVSEGNSVNTNDDKIFVQSSDTNLKRKLETSPNLLDLKKHKVEVENTNVQALPNNLVTSAATNNKISKSSETQKINEIVESPKPQFIGSTSKVPVKSNNITNVTKDTKQIQKIVSSKSHNENYSLKRPNQVQLNVVSSKRKPGSSDILSSPQPSSSNQKTVSPLKLQLPKVEPQKNVETLKPVLKKIPDLKPSIPPTTLSVNKPVSKVRMDLLANNSDPTIDRSKILSQVKSCLSSPNVSQSSGDPLKSLFDSCKINIPSSLSITLTDQKSESKSLNEQENTELNKMVINKTLASASSTGNHKVPSPPVHNFIEILKIPDSDVKKAQNKQETAIESNTEYKQNQPKIENNVSKSMKLPEISSKGPVPNLKPISDTKLSKQSGNVSSPITFQQTFEQQLQSLQADKKSKFPKSKAQVPKLVPATPKSLNAASKLNTPKPVSLTMQTENKVSSALDLSNPHSVQSQLGPQQTKAFETMQSIANLAKKQNMQTKFVTSAITNNTVSNVYTTGSNSLRTSTSNQMVHDHISSQASPTNLKADISTKGSQSKGNSTNQSPNYHSPSLNYSHQTQPSPRSQTRSPSSSPKLVIAEEKQTPSLTSEHNQSNQISSSQLSNVAVKIASPDSSPGTSKSVSKPLKTASSSSKNTPMRQPIIPLKSNTFSNPSDAHYVPQPQLLSAHALLRQQMEIHNAFLKAQFMSNISHQASQNDFRKDKQ